MSIRTNKKGETFEVVGPIEKRFRYMADEAHLSPHDLLEKMIAEGTSQNEIAKVLGCTRQAVSFLARRHGIEFPGRLIDLDGQVQEKTKLADFETFFGENINLSYDQMSAILEVSVSTIKRRARQILKDRLAG